MNDEYVDTLLELNKLEEIVHLLVKNDEHLSNYEYDYDKLLTTLRERLNH